MEENEIMIEQTIGEVGSKTINMELVVEAWVMLKQG